MKLGQKIKMMKQQKYLLFGDGLSPHTLKWVKELQKYFDVYMISSQSFLAEFDEILAENKRFSLKVNVSQTKISLGYFSKTLSLRKILKQLKPDFVNAHFISSHGLLIVLSSLFIKHKFTFIASAWGTDVLVFPWKNKLFFYAMKAVFAKADWLTSDSEYMTSVMKKIKNKPILTFTFGLDSLPNYDDAKLDNKLYYSNRGLSPNYNIDKVLRVFANIYKQDKEARLIISNEGTEKENLVNLAVKLGIEKTVNFMGYISESEQIEIYSKACCYFSLPSSDSTSVSLLEAMAYGCIPILSDIPANKEWVKDGVNGLIIQQDIDDDKLLQLKDNRQQIIKDNRNIIAKKAIFPDLINRFVKEISVDK